MLRAYSGIIEPTRDAAWPPMLLPYNAIRAGSTKGKVLNHRMSCWCCLPTDDHRVVRVGLAIRSIHLNLVSPVQFPNGVKTTKPLSASLRPASKYPAPSLRAVVGRPPRPC